MLDLGVVAEINNSQMTNTFIICDVNAYTGGKGGKKLNAPAKICPPKAIMQILVFLVSLHY